MNHLKNLLVLLVCMMLNNKSFSQLNCASKINLAQIQQNNPARYQRILALEQHTQNYINTVSNGSNSARLINQNSTIIIPVVVHVLHRGEAIGVGRNISDAQVQSQIAVLNEDFRRLNADRVNTPNVFQPVAADPNFEFRLSCIDPNGNITNGITRTVANRNTFFPTQNLNSDGSINEQNTGIKFNSTGGRDAWPTNSYLNIWVCEMGNGLIGYGQFPDEYTVKANTDGVVMQFNAFGRVGTLQAGLNQGRVCVHEIGHWLNLRHVWGDANCGDDLVGDTPPQQTSNSGCPTFPRTSGCVGNGTNGDMFMNYMDYTLNGCMNIYTTGQSLRMRAIFAQGGPRASFINNYLRVTPRTTPICNTGTITATNPMCLPITWSIVSGPATIIGGQGTNTVTLQNSGNGTAVVRAATNSYVDETNVIMGVGINSINYTQKEVVCEGRRAYFYGAVQQIPFATNFEWYSKDESVGASPFVLQQSMNANTADFPLPGNDRQYTIRIIASNQCGSITSIDAEGYIYAPSCVGREQNRTIQISPNPSKNNISVQLKPTTDKFVKIQSSNINKVIITKRFGLALISKTFGTGTQIASIDISMLSTGFYLIKIWDGTQWLTSKFIKE